MMQFAPVTTAAQFLQAYLQSAAAPQPVPQHFQEGGFARPWWTKQKSAAALCSKVQNTSTKWQWLTACTSLSVAAAL